MDNQSLSHTKWKCQYHVVFIPKYRRRDFWRIVPETKKDCCSWYFVICQLVRNVSSSEKEKVLFQEKYSALVYLERKGADRIRNKIIEQTGRWVRHSHLDFCTYEFGDF